MNVIDDHALRYTLANELHARPFPLVKSPSRAAFLAIKPTSNPASRDKAAERAHLLALLDRFGAQHPQPEATHYFGNLGSFYLKWESHSEFVTYMAIVDGLETRPFDKAAFDIFPADWLSEAPGQRLTSALIRFEPETDDDKVADRVADWLVRESLAISSILDGSAIVAGDFRIDSGGHMRFAVFPRGDAADGRSSSRMGRVLQRLCEIETYKAISMLGFARARELGTELGALDIRLGNLMEAMTNNSEPADQTLAQFLEITALLENLLSQTAFRFAATKAYAALVKERIAALREERFRSRQTFAEFMTRRFDPAMRTVVATEARLKNMAERAARAGDLLRTRVDVERSAQNQDLLASMDRRADLQLRLQETVEGLSVVAISYYAVSLASFLVVPFAEEFDVSEAVLTAMLVPFVLVLVFWMVRRVRRRINGRT
ncbi:MAG: DUF3422 domain-containing protein [Pseudomonadota bacterium]